VDGQKGNNYVYGEGGREKQKKREVSEGYSSGDRKRNNSLRMIEEKPHFSGSFFVFSISASRRGIFRADECLCFLKTTEKREKKLSKHLIDSPRNTRVPRGEATRRPKIIGKLFEAPCHQGIESPRRPHSVRCLGE
jgi:hypothetical protein